MVLTLVDARLGVGVVVQKEEGDLLVWLLTNIHPAMDKGDRFIPIDLTRTDGQPLPGSAVAVLDREGIATEHERDTVIGIAMPGRALAQRQPLASNERLVPPVKDLFSHRRDVRLSNAHVDRPRRANASQRPGPA
jgi:hypothetical protein